MARNRTFARSLHDLVLPILSGAVIVLGTALGESERPAQMLAGVVQRVDPRR